MYSLLVLFLLFGAAQCDLTLFNSCNETLSVVKNGENLTEIDPGRKFVDTERITFDHIKIGKDGQTEVFLTTSFTRVFISIDISRGFDVPMRATYGNRRAELSCLVPACFGIDSNGRPIEFKEVTATRHTGLFSNILDSFDITFCP